jgi:hypothetical protein
MAMHRTSIGWDRDLPGSSRPWAMAAETQAMPANPPEIMMMTTVTVPTGRKTLARVRTVARMKTMRMQMVTRMEAMRVQMMTRMETLRVLTMTRMKTLMKVKTWY